MTIHDWYFDHHNKFVRKYGKDKTIVIIQIGSFYEIYATDDMGPDIHYLAHLLNLKKTLKNNNIPGIGVNNPYMIGFPFPKLDKFLGVLIQHGFTCIIIDQEITYSTSGKKEVERSISRIESPGTYIQNISTPDATNIVCLYIEDEIQRNGSVLICIGMSVLDLTTGDCMIHEEYGVESDELKALDEAARFIYEKTPKEILIYRNKIKTKHKIKSQEEIVAYLELEAKPFHWHNRLPKKTFNKISFQEKYLSEMFNLGSIESPLDELLISHLPYATLSLMSILEFAHDHDENITNHLNLPQIYRNTMHLVLGNNAIYQLNILEEEGQEFINRRFKSLFDVVNNTSTAIGRRFLKNALTSPILSRDRLLMRYGCIEEALSENIWQKLEVHLKEILDLERLQRRLSLNRLSPHEFYGLYYSLLEVQKLINLCKNTKVISKVVPDAVDLNSIDKLIKDAENNLDFDNMKQCTLTGIEDSFFKPGVNKAIDKLQREICASEDLLDNICQVLTMNIDDVGKAKMLGKEGTLKVRLEKTASGERYLKTTLLRGKSLRENLKSAKSIKITENYTLQVKDLQFKEQKNHMKITFQHLSENTDALVIMKDKIKLMIREEWLKLLECYYEQYYTAIQRLTRFVSIIDFTKSCAKTATLYGYTKPELVLDDENGDLLPWGFVSCEQLRHPIIERIRNGVEYVPHSITLGKDPTKIDDKTTALNGMLIYGLNSAGKSALMKAIGLSIVMAQAGMYVPAHSYRFSPYGSLFTRITSNDNLFRGLSSFALEMTELKAILRRNGPRTLVIGDEVCRGTEHISGNSIVAATLIKLAKTGSSFIFATHLHEIARMERIKNLPNVKAFHLTVECDKETDELIFDRKLKPGSGPPVYGVTVAKHIIKDDDFTKLTLEIQRELMDTVGSFLTDKTSKYNSNVYMHSCTTCGVSYGMSDSVGGRIGKLDTHHINHQKDCENGFVIEKPHIKVHDRANLVVLCKPCHYKVHHGGLEINGYIDTSSGPKLDFRFIDDVEYTEEQIIQPKRKKVRRRKK